VTVEELLDESDLIQELKQQNSKLIEYLRDDKVLDRLLRYVTAPKSTGSPDEEASGVEGGEKSRSASRDSFFGKVTGKARSASITKSEAGDGEESKEEKQRMKYAYVACEILSSEVWSISEAVLENQESLRQFWNYIKQPAPLDPVQAGYFTKVNESLFDRKMEEMMDFFKSIDNVVPDMLQHVDCPMIMDLLLKIISLEKSEGGQGIVDVSVYVLTCLLTANKVFSGCSRRISFLSSCRIYLPTRAHPPKPRQGTSSRLLLPFQPTPRPRINQLLGLMSSHGSWFPNPVSKRSSQICSEEATP
jgi:hypothetical protein